MKDGLKATIQFLARTVNEAAVDVLVAALADPDSTIREEALRALLERPNPTGHLEVFARLGTFDQRCRAIVAERPERFTTAAAKAVADPKARATACQMMLDYRLYETLPALLAELGGAGPHIDRIAATVLNLTERFYGELSTATVQSRRKDIESLRQKLTMALEESVRKYGQHRRSEVVEAFLVLAKPQNVTLRYLLQQRGDPVFAAITEILSTSSRGGVLRLLLGFLEDPPVPQAVKKLLAGRKDLKFVENLVLSLGRKPSRGATESLAQIDGFAWALAKDGILDQLSESAQARAVGVLSASGMKRNELLRVLGHLLQRGSIEGRRAAIQAIADFEGPEATALVIRAINADDPMVRAEALRQLRPRKIPGALSLLIRMVDTPHEEVRQALREAMPEFSLQQFLVKVESIDEALLPAAGQLVRRVDSGAIAQLGEEMQRLSPVRRRRAVIAADAMDAVRELEARVIQLLGDEDHLVRIAAARALAACGTKPSWEALRDALLDRSVIVQEAAEQSLERISRTLLSEMSGETEDLEMEQPVR